jgi:hypothetical protein
MLAQTGVAALGLSCQSEFQLLGEEHLPRATIIHLRSIRKYRVRDISLSRNIRNSSPCRIIHTLESAPNGVEILSDLL